MSDSQTVKVERQKARELRQSRWWKEKLANGVCYYCGDQFVAKELTMDHVLPLSRGGRSTKGNIVASCKKCNTEKKDRGPLDLLLEV